VPSTLTLLKSQEREKLMRVKNAFVSYEMTSIVCPKCDGTEYFEKEGIRKLFLCKECDQVMKVGMSKFRFEILGWLIFIPGFLILFGLLMSPLFLFL
jgi:hypothetical protein